MRILRPRTKLGRSTLWLGRTERPLDGFALDHPFCVWIEAHWLGDVRNRNFHILRSAAYLSPGPAASSCVRSIILMGTLS